MKDDYENRTRLSLPRRTYTIIRMDGKAFHTFTRGMQKPFDEQLVEDMQETTIGLCEKIEGVVLAYTQSDEISLLLTDFATMQTEAWFDGNLQKICSISASIATQEFNKLMALRYGLDCIAWARNMDSEEFRANATYNDEPRLRTANFDSRVFTIPDPVEVENYFIWRQKDATRNAIQMVAQSLYSHKELQNKGWSDLNEMIFQKGKNFNDYHSHYKRGSVVVKRFYTEQMQNRKTWQWETVTRGKWEVLEETPMFTDEAGRQFLKDTIPVRGY